ncbi:MAG TPA: response regulator [Azospirillum sp.]|nr:response regulator [Azospirillum sp.]
MSRHTILLVEDNADDAELTQTALARTRVDATLDIVTGGEDALDYLFGDGRPLPALVLLDLNLRGMSGLDVLHRIRARGATRRLPVVILTTSDNASDIAAGYDLGVNSYVRKPADLDSFTEVMRRLGLYWLHTNTPPPAAG